MRKRILASALMIAAATMLASGAVTTKSSKVKISGKDCKRLVRHESASADYKPGVDVRGRRVAGADLAGSKSKIKLPKTIEFDIALNPLKGAAATKFGETSAGVGKVKYDFGKKSFTFNGQQLGDKDIAKLRAKCRQRMGR